MSSFIEKLREKLDLQITNRHIIEEYIDKSVKLVQRCPTIEFQKNVLDFVSFVGENLVHYKFVRGTPRIVCAANIIHITHLEGVKLDIPRMHIVTGARHFDTIMHNQLDLLKESGAQWTHTIREQGFIDQRGKYITREDAWRIAEANGQIIDHVSSPGTLYSENLY